MNRLQLSGLFRAGLLLAAFALAIVPLAAAQAVSSQDVSFSAGIVLSVDPQAGVMTVDEAGSPQTLTFQIPRGVQITKDEAAIELGGIEIGDPVAIEYRESGRRPTVVSVKVITPPRED